MLIENQALMYYITVYKFNLPIHHCSNSSDLTWWWYIFLMNDTLLLMLVQILTILLNQHKTVVSPETVACIYIKQTNKTSNWSRFNWCSVTQQQKISDITKHEPRPAVKQHSKNSIQSGKKPITYGKTKYSIRDNSKGF